MAVLKRINPRAVHSRACERIPLNQKPPRLPRRRAGCRHSVAACVSDHSRACERIPLRHRSNLQRKKQHRHSGIFRVADLGPGTMPRGKYPESPAPAGSHALISRTPTPGGMLHANLGLPRPPPRNFQPPLPRFPSRLSPRRMSGTTVGRILSHPLPWSTHARHRSNPQEKNNIVIPEFSAWLTLVLEQCRAENIRNLPRQRAPTPLFPERRPREACSMPISGCHDLPLATFNLPSRVFRHGCRHAECLERRWGGFFHTPSRGQALTPATALSPNGNNTPPPSSFRTSFRASGRKISGISAARRGIPPKLRLRCREATERRGRRGHLFLSSNMWRTKRKRAGQT